MLSWRILVGAADSLTIHNGKALRASHSLCKSRRPPDLDMETALVCLAYRSGNHANVGYDAVGFGFLGCILAFVGALKFFPCFTRAGWTMHAIFLWIPESGDAPFHHFEPLYSGVFVRVI